MVTSTMVGKSITTAMVAALLGVAGCIIDVDHGNTRFRCDETPECPTGHTCVAGECVSSVGIDAGGDADVDVDPGPDAAVAPRVDGDLLWFSFEDYAITNVAHDRSGNLRHGMLRWPSEAQGRYGRAFYFEDGAAESVLIPDHAALFTGSDITIEAWIEHDDVDEDDTIYGDDDPDASGSTLEYRFSITTENVLRFATSDGCDGAVAVAVGSPDTAILMNDWVHVAVTWDGSEVRFYLDGELADTVALQATPCESASPRPYWIARSGGSNPTAYQGRIDELKVSSYAKSAADIAASMTHDGGAVAVCGDGVLEGEACEGDAPCCASCSLAAAASSCATGGSCTAAGVCDDGGARPQDDLLVLYEFDEGAGDVVRDTSGVGTPLDLSIPDATAVTWGEGYLEIVASTLLVSGVPATKVRDAAVASDEVTVEAWVVPANTTQDGPARVVTISRDTGSRNLLLGQEDQAFVGRVRSRRSNWNGEPAIDTPEGEVALRLTHVVITRDASGLRRLFVDGVERGRGIVEGDLGSWSADYAIALANELTFDRPWLGELHRVAIYGRALAPIEVHRAFLAGP